MAQNEPQRKETPPGPSPNSPSFLFEYQCTSGKFIILANRIESKLFLPELECSSTCLLRICEVIDMSGERIFCRSRSCHILWATVTLWRVESDTQSFHEMHGFGTELEESNTVAHKCQRPENPQHKNLKLLCCGFSGRWHVGHRSLTPHPKAKKLFLQTKNKILNS